MTAVRIIKPSIVIGGTEFKCMSREVSLEPGDWINFCEQEWSLSVEVELGYGVGESWTVLQAMQDTDQLCVMRPSDGVLSATNPKATFTANIPAIPFLAGATRGERQTFTLDLTTNASPVFAVV